MRSDIVKEQKLSSEMVEALENGQFEVYYQPQYDYENNSLVGAEALVRWNHPEKGMISPAVFIPMFERNGFITVLDEYVWEKACQDLRKWMDDKEKYIPISVSVNISRIDIYNPNLCKTLKNLVKKYNLNASALKLEITESAYMQSPEQLINVTKDLRANGFIVEMDDFGAGYSSLNILKDVPVDILKLDVNFLSKGEDDSKGGHILSSIIRMAHWLNIPVIAEGVETKEQADYLKSLSCVYMQGYYFSKPLPKNEFEKILVKSEVGDTKKYSSTNLEGIAEFWNPSARSEERRVGKEC